MCAQTARAVGGKVVEQAEPESGDPQAASPDSDLPRALSSDETLQSLVSRIRTNDQTAIAELYRELYRPLWTLAVRIVKSAEAAEEILHDVFFGLWNRRESLQPGDDVRAYLYASVRNRALNHAHHDRVVTTAETAIQQQVVDARIIGRIGPSPDEALATDEFYRAYSRTLATLSERERVALQLRWEEELSLEQIAGILGLSIEGVRRLILRVQKKVQIMLAEYRG